MICTNLPILHSYQTKIISLSTSNLKHQKMDKGITSPLLLYMIPLSPPAIGKIRS